MFDHRAVCGTWLWLWFAVAASAATAGEPMIVAHRGLLRHAPENTLANFRACLELRLGFEFDVARTKDGQLVCIHDDTLERTTDGQGRVADRIWAELQQLDAGSWFDPQFRGERIPTVDEVLKLVSEYRDRNVLIAVDLKTAETEQAVVELAAKHRVLDRLLFIGRTITQADVRQRIKASSPQAETAAVANTAEEFPQTLRASADWVYFRYVPAPGEVSAVHAAGKRAFIAGATVAGQKPENWRLATAAGIDAILTDYPLELRQQLAVDR